MRVLMIAKAVVLVILLARSGCAQQNELVETKINEALMGKHFEVTEGLALLRDLACQPENIVFHSHQARLKNMQSWDTDFRWPTVYGNNGTITVTAPWAGAFYPAVVIYDVEEPPHLPRVPAMLNYPPGLGSYRMSVDGEVVGGFVPAEQDNRQRLFFLNHPIEF